MLTWMMYFKTLVTTCHDIKGQEEQLVGKRVCHPQVSLLEIQAGYFQCWTNFLLTKQGSLTEIRPTFLWTSSATAKQRAAVLGAYIVDNWQDATVHVVDSFESPGQRVSWASKLGGHLIVTRDLQDGPWIQFPNCKFHLNSLIARHVSVTFNLMTQSSLQKFEELRYHPAGKIMTQRNLLITAEFAQLHQGIVEILRYSMENGWKLFETCQFKDFRRTHKEF